MTHFPDGSYRRRLRTVITAPGVVEGGLEDDFHHFSVRARATTAALVSAVDGRRASAGRGRRAPTPPDPLRALEGMELSRPVPRGRRRSPTRSRTARTCSTSPGSAWRTPPGAVTIGTTRQYDIEIPAAAQARAIDGRHVPRRDGQLAHEWTLDGRRCVAPEPYASAPWRGGLLALGRRDVRSRRGRSRDRPAARLRHRHGPRHGPRRGRRGRWSWNL